MSKIEHTELPWKTGVKENTVLNIDESIICDPTDGLAFVFLPYHISVGKEVQEANADFIVRACNSHDRLKEINAELLGELIRADSIIHKLRKLVSHYGYVEELPGLRKRQRTTAILKAQQPKEQEGISDDR